MPDSNIPNNKHEAAIYLKSRKQAYLDLAAEVCENDMKTANQISGLIFNKIEELDQALELY